MIMKCLSPGGARPATIPPQCLTKRAPRQQMQSPAMLSVRTCDCQPYPVEPFSFSSPKFCSLHSAGLQALNESMTGSHAELDNIPEAIGE